MVSAGTDGCNLCFGDNYCSKTTVTKLSHKTKKKTNAASGIVSVVLDSPATIFAHDVIFTYTISVMYVRIRSCGLCCVIAANGL